MAKGLLFVAFDFSGAHADEFHDWYDLEHIPERLGVPGFINAERWIGDDNPKIAVAAYDLDSPGVLHSPPYQTVGGSNSSVWTKRVTAMCQRLLRYEGEQVLPGDATAPAGAGALLAATMNVDPAAEHEFNESVQYRAPAAACRRAGRAVCPPLPRVGHRKRTEIRRDLPPHGSGRVALGGVDQGGRHRMDPPDAPAFPRHAGAALQALRPLTPPLASEAGPDRLPLRGRERDAMGLGAGAGRLGASVSASWYNSWRVTALADT